MNATIKEQEEYDVDRILPWTLFDPPELETPELAEVRNARAATDRRCGFGLVLLRALSAWPT
jgi:hypothetical protein